MPGADRCFDQPPSNPRAPNGDGHGFGVATRGPLHSRVATRRDMALALGRRRATTGVCAAAPVEDTVSVQSKTPWRKYRGYAYDDIREQLRVIGRAQISACAPTGNRIGTTSGIDGADARDQNGAVLRAIERGRSSTRAQVAGGSLRRGTDMRRHRVATKAPRRHALGPGCVASPCCTCSRTTPRSVCAAGWGRCARCQVSG